MAARTDDFTVGSKADSGGGWRSVAAKDGQPTGVRSASRPATLRTADFGCSASVRQSRTDKSRAGTTRVDH
jgi:hypothetical protein